MKSLIIAVLAALACLSSAQNTSATIQQYAVFVPNGATFNVVNFTAQGANAYSVVSGGEIYAIFTKGMLGMEPVTDSKKIEAALHDYYVSIGLSSDAVDQFAPVHQGILNISDTRRAGEKECWRLSGNENSFCDSFDSCKSVCLGTPFCPNFANGGAPGEFINVLMDFRNRTLAVDRAYALENSTYAIFSAAKTKENMAAYLSSLETVNRAAGAASQSQLYDYSFCAQPDYSLPQITNLQLSAQKYYNSASSFFSISSEALKIRNRTLEGLERESQVPLFPVIQNNSTAPSALPANPLNDSANNSSSAGAPASTAQPLPLAEIAIVGAVLLLVVAVGAGIYFFARKRKGL